MWKAICFNPGLSNSFLFHWKYPCVYLLKFELSFSYSFPSTENLSLASLQKCFLHFCPGPDGQEVLLVAVPDFSVTQTACLVNLHTLHCEPVSFSAFSAKDDEESQMNISHWGYVYPFHALFWDCLDNLKQPPLQKVKCLATSTSWFWTDITIFFLMCQWWNDKFVLTSIYLKIISSNKTCPSLQNLFTPVSKCKTLSEHFILQHVFQVVNKASVNKLWSKKKKVRTFDVLPQYYTKPFIKQLNIW